MNNLTTLEHADDRQSDDAQIATRDNMDIATTRSAQEVQAAMVIAKKFPRDENRAFTRIIAACKRKTLADQAIYTFPRGDTTVEGPSIRLAEVLAQAWQNVDFGIIPGDIVDAAVEECNKTMAATDGQAPLIDRVRQMAVAFGEFGVTTVMLEKRIGHKLDATSEAEFAALRKIFRAIRDGMGSRESYFDLGDAPASRPPPPEKAAQGAAAAIEPTKRKRSAPPPKQEPAAETKPEQKATRTELADAETIDCVVRADKIECLLISQQPSAKLDLVGDFAGIAYHVGGAKADGDNLVPAPVWKLNRPVKAQLLGKKQKNGTIIIFVQHAELPAAPEIEA